MIHMPAKSYNGLWKPLTPEEASLRDALKADVQTLGGDIGVRNIFTYDNYMAAKDFITSSFAGAGYEVTLLPFQVEGQTCFNIAVEISGGTRSEEIVVIGAHYDSVPGSPAANDNASGVAAVLALARAFSDTSPARTLRFVAFANEEPPFFQTKGMGSLVYAKNSQEKDEQIVAMMSVETIGYYSEEEGSQNYPFPFSLFYPSRGNFIGFVSDLSSRSLVREVVESFRNHTPFPSEAAAIPSFITGVGWSDHWSFWQAGYPAIMITDTAVFRYPYYHTAQDTPDKLDYDRMARVVHGLDSVIRKLVDPEDAQGGRP